MTNTILGLMTLLTLMGYISLRKENKAILGGIRAVKKETSEEVQAAKEELRKGIKDLKQIIIYPNNKVVYIPMASIKNAK